MVSSFYLFHIGFLWICSSYCLLLCDIFMLRRFIEGDFDAYVERIEKPYVWGGEPELLMASHVLKWVLLLSYDWSFCQCLFIYPTILRCWCCIFTMEGSNATIRKVWRKENKLLPGGKKSESTLYCDSMHVVVYDSTTWLVYALNTIISVVG